MSLGLLGRHGRRGGRKRAGGSLDTCGQLDIGRRCRCPWGRGAGDANPFLAFLYLEFGNSRALDEFDQRLELSQIHQITQPGVRIIGTGNVAGKIVPFGRSLIQLAADIIGEITANMCQ